MKAIRTLVVEVCVRADSVSLPECQIELRQSEQAGGVKGLDERDLRLFSIQE